MADEHYENAKLAEIYDLDSGWSIDRDFYLSLAGDSPEYILDLGCGTGLLCNAYAEKGHHVTGADPSAKMLEVAKRKPFAKNIEWVQATAQTFSSTKQFDLIIMTGHAFQVLLEETDVLAAFSAMRNHLKPDGQIVFESRNPNIDWAKSWNYEMEIALPSGKVLESRKFVSMSEGRMKFDLIYDFPDKQLVSKSELKFLSRQRIEQLLNKSDLRVETVFGDWHGNPLDERTSEEMIFTVRKTSKCNC